uniref:Uncharacterized protein n=1 Tax=Romanomermis culicivorax TaxID=13658 RepID=A0A915IC14_ROMCU
MFRIVAEELMLYSDVCQSIISLNELLQIICQLSVYVDDSEFGAKIAKLALDSLKKEWPDFDVFSQKSATAKTNAVIKSLLSIYFSKQTNKRLNVCEKMIQSVLERGVEKSDDMFTVEDYKTVNKNTYPVWYAALFHELVSCTREIALTIGDSE